MQSELVIASYTGGAPGPVTYAWSFIAPASPSPTGFINPAGASSQRVAFYGVPQGAAHSRGVRVTVTDSLGNAATDDTVASVFREF